MAVFSPHIFAGMAMTILNWEELPPSSSQNGEIPQLTWIIVPHHPVTLIRYSITLTAKGHSEGQIVIH
jgi:hypothetical protein